MAKSYSYILFDLDGTLTDSGPGIMNGFAYAIEKMGDQVTDREQLKKFVGPPLKDSFNRVLGYNEEDTDKAIKLYREYYNTMGGVLENSVYPGIEQLLADLSAEGKTLIVATSKSEYATNVVLEHFGLRKYFEFVATADDKDRPRKADVIRYVFEQCKIADKSRAVMIGDRENDISAAKEVGIDSVGVLYGYGDREELTNAGATYIAESAADVKPLVC
ncbi:MAG: HAD-IA family hydrolase [Butyrivibrio sp.]|nr:HAD-IA family hydrolase [Butyrivibrio sp.]